MYLMIRSILILQLCNNTHNNGIAYICLRLNIQLFNEHLYPNVCNNMGGAVRVFCVHKSEKCCLEVDQLKNFEEDIEVRH